jgi:hypothetical protein
MSNCLPFAGRTYHFPSANSSNAWLSRDRSATNCFNRAFASFRALNSCTVSRSAPQYFPCQRCYVAGLLPKALHTSSTLFLPAKAVADSRSIFTICSALCLVLFMIFKERLRPPKTLITSGSI